MSEDLTPFLQPDPVIDADAPTIVALAGALAAETTSDAEYARRAFEWVRDQVRHSIDHQGSQVTCVASEVLAYGEGFCYAKSHLLAALLRARGVPAALVYQRLALDGEGTRFCLHGLVAIHLRGHGWYRADPRGNTSTISTHFTPPVEQLAFRPARPGELDLPGRFATPLPSVLRALRPGRSVEHVAGDLPDERAAIADGNDDPADAHPNPPLKRSEIL